MLMQEIMFREMAASCFPVATTWSTCFSEVNDHWYKCSVRPHTHTVLVLAAFPHILTASEINDVFNYFQVLGRGLAGKEFHLSTVTAHTHTNNKCKTLYLNVKVAVEALDEDDEGACQVVPRRGLDRLARIFWSCPNQEALRGWHRQSWHSDRNTWVT